jgi:hypothetical protein
MQVVRKKDPKTMLDLGDKDELHSGDQVFMWIKLNQPAYVYILNGADKGHIVPLYPEDGSQLIPPNEEQQLPPPGDAIVIDKNTGVENFFVIASPKALSKDELVKQAEANLPQKVKSNRRPSPPTQEKSREQATQTASKQEKVTMTDKDSALMSTLSAYRKRSHSSFTGVMAEDSGRDVLKLFTYQHKP